MAVPTVVCVAGRADAGGAVRFCSDFPRAGPMPRLSHRPSKHFGWFCTKGYPLHKLKCIWRIPSSEDKSKFMSRNDMSLPALGKNDFSEDTDEMYDELFKKYGKVAFRRKDQKPLTAEIDDDAESLSFALEMARVASEVKAADIKVLFVKPLVYWTRFFIIATAYSRPQIDAIGSKIRDLAEKKYGKVPSGDSKPNSWTLLDYGEVVIHIFLPPQRAFYNLEEFYGNATPIELPFENQPPLCS